MSEYGSDWSDNDNKEYKDDKEIEKEIDKEVDVEKEFKTDYDPQDLDTKEYHPFTPPDLTLNDDDSKEYDPFTPPDLTLNDDDSKEYDPFTPPDLTLNDNDSKEYDPFTPPDLTLNDDDSKEYDPFTPPDLTLNDDDSKEYDPFTPPDLTLNDNDSKEYDPFTPPDLTLNDDDSKEYDPFTPPDLTLKGESSIEEIEEDIIKNEPEFFEAKSIDHEITFDHIYEKDLEDIVKDIDQAEELHAIYAEDIMIPSGDKEAVEQYYMEQMKAEGVIITNELYFEKIHDNKQATVDHLKETEIDFIDKDNDQLKKELVQETKGNFTEIDGKEISLANDIEYENKIHELREDCKEINEHHEEIQIQEKTELDVSKSEVKDILHIDKEQEIPYKYSSGQHATQILKQEVEEIPNQEPQEIKEEKPNEAEEIRQIEVKKTLIPEIKNEVDKKKISQEIEKDHINSSSGKKENEITTEKSEFDHKSIEQEAEIKYNKREKFNNEIDFKEEWEKTLVEWIKGVKDEDLPPEKRGELIEFMRKYRNAREEHSRLHYLNLKHTKKEISEEEKQEHKYLREKIKDYDEVDEEMFKEFHAFRCFYDYNKKRWYDTVTNSKKKRYPKLVAQKLERLKNKRIKKTQDFREWSDALKSQIHNISDEIISQEIKDEITYVIDNYNNLQKTSKNLPSKLRQVAEELRQFQTTYNVYKERGYEKSIPREVGGAAKKLRKSLELIKNEAILGIVLGGSKRELQNFKEILRENLYKCKMSLNEKSKINKIIQKERLSDEDKRQILTILNKITLNELNVILNDDFKQISKVFNKAGLNRNKNSLDKLLTLIDKEPHKKIRLKSTLPELIEVLKAEFNQNKWDPGQIPDRFDVLLKKMHGNDIKTFQKIVKAVPYTLNDIGKKSKHRSTLKIYNAVIHPQKNPKSLIPANFLEAVKLLNNKIPRSLPTFKIKLSVDEVQKLTVKQFFRLIKEEVQNILGVKVNYRELSKEYLGMKNKWYVNDRILDSLRFTEYALPTASLNKFKRELVDIFKEKSAYFEYIVGLYKSMNPSHFQKFDITSEYFAEINTLEKAYWFGFLLAEATMRVKGKNKRLELGLGALDLDHIIKFGREIQFDLRRGLKYIRKEGKEEKTYRSFSLGFSDSKFCKYLIENGFPESGKTSSNLDLRFPYWVLSDKRLVMAMLLGFFDGDGSHGYELPKSQPKEKQKYMKPTIQLHARQFLQDIKDYFKDDIGVISGPYEDGRFVLDLERRFFNDLIENYKDSMKRKLYKYDLDAVDLRYNAKFKLSKEELKKLWENGWSDSKIAKYHTVKHGKLSETTVRYWRIEWNLLKPSNPKAYWKVTVDKLGKGWSLEDIYINEFHYIYDPTYWHNRRDLEDKYKKWFAYDLMVKNNNGEVSLRKIVEVYGNLKNNPLVTTQKEKVILRKKEGWSLERIYTEELGYKYDPSNADHRYMMKQKYKEIFKNDPLVMTSGDILKNIEDIYNPANKL